MDIPKNNNYDRQLHKQRKRLVLNIIKHVTDIEAFLHRTRFSIPRLNYSNIEQIFPGRVGVLNGSKSIAKEKMRGLYKQAGFIRLITGKQLTTYFSTSPKTQGLPWFMFDLISPTIEDLMEIDRAFTAYRTKGAKRELTENERNYYYPKTSSIEYTIDFYCDSQQAVADMFWLLRQYCFFVRSKSTSIVGGKFYGLEQPINPEDFRDVNTVYHVFNSDNKNKKNSRKAKIYERGDDDCKRDNGGWYHQDCNRVRYEYVLKRNALRANGLKDIKDLLNGPKFYDFFFPASDLDLIQFRYFLNKNYKEYRPPMDGDNFTAKDEDGNSECFQEEYYKARKEGLNTSNSTAHYPNLDNFKKRIKEAILEFEKKCKEDVKKLRSK